MFLSFYLTSVDRWTLLGFLDFVFLYFCTRISCVGLQLVFSIFFRLLSLQGLCVVCLINVRIIMKCSAVLCCSVLFCAAVFLMRLNSSSMQFCPFKVQLRNPMARSKEIGLEKIVSYPGCSWSLQSWWVKMFGDF